MNNTYPFDVAPGSAAIVTLLGLSPDDTLLVEYSPIDPGCPGGADQVWVPFSPGGCQWEITSKYNPKKFDTPGAYRLVFEGAPNTTPEFGFAKTVVQL